MLNITEVSEFDNHVLVSFIGDKDAGFHGFAAMHRGNQTIPAFGATRIWNYSSDELALRDALRLSKLMTYKLLMADCMYGGAKIILVRDTNKTIDQGKFLHSFAQIINSFRGGIITGADVGVNQQDLQTLSEKTKFVMGIHSDPVSTTIQGVFSCMMPCLEMRLQTDSLKSKSVAIQGLGKIGYGLLELFVNAEAIVYASDINETVKQNVMTKYPQVQFVAPEKIHTLPVDIFVPCALSNAITEANSNDLQCSIIAGSANCQLENDHVADILHKKNILYAPDFIVNAGGIISVIDEYENGTADVDRVAQKIQKMKQGLTSILQQSKEKNCSPLIIANMNAVERLSHLV